MSYLLNIETATRVCSVAIGRDGELIALKETNKEKSHSSVITLLIQEVLKKAGIVLSDLDAIAVSKGPGSYTGLRIGVSTAKGLCYSLDRPLIAVNTLQAMAISRVENKSEIPILYCPMIDARRMEVYTAFYDADNNEVRKPGADIIDKNSYANILDKNKVVFFGDGAAKCKDALSHHANAIFVDDARPVGRNNRIGVFPSARNMIPLSEKSFNDRQFEDVAYFEPYYLKDFIAQK